MDLNIAVDWTQAGTELARAAAATGLGALIGLERQVHGHWAGIRTHIGVSLGAAVFILSSLAVAPPPAADTTRVIQGVAAGIGFLGAGTILKLSDRLEVKGLTTASSIWLAAAIGTSCGLGRYTLAIISTVLTLFVLAVLRPLEKRLPVYRHADSSETRK